MMKNVINITRKIYGTEILKISVSLAIVLLSMTIIGSADNLLLNPGFENGTAGSPNNWGKYYPGTQASPFSYPEPGIIGGYSAAINFTVADSKEADWVQSVVSISSANAYKLSGWMKTQNVNGTGGVTIKVDWYTSSWTWISSSSLVSQKRGTVGWTYFEKNITNVPSNAVNSHIILQLINATGKVWFDDMYFATYNNTPPIQITNISDYYTVAVGDTITISPVHIDNGIFSTDFNEGNFNTTTGELIWSPTVSDLGAHFLEIGVNYGGYRTQKNFSISVSNYLPNQVSNMTYSFGKIDGISKYWINYSWQSSKPVLRFLIGSDLHYGLGTTPGYQNMVNSINTEANSSKGLNLVVLNGDLANSDTVGVTALADLKNKYLVNISVPYYVVYGNHDLANNSYWKSLFGVNKDYSFVKGNYAFVVLSTSNENGAFLQANATYLDQQLTLYSDKLVFVFMHIPRHAWTGNDIEMTNINNVLGNHTNVVATFHGHDHDRPDCIYADNTYSCWDERLGDFNDVNFNNPYTGYRIVEVNLDGSIISYDVNTSQPLNRFSLPTINVLRAKSDSYNVNFNGILTNGNNTYLNRTIPVGTWANITVSSSNNTGSGSLSLGSVSQNVHIIGNYSPIVSSDPIPPVSDR